MPYNPQTYDRSGENLAAGISQAGHALGQGLEKFFERRKKEAEAIATSRKIIKMIGGEEYDDKAIQDMPGQEAKATALALQVRNDLDYQKLQKRQMDQAYEKGKMEMQQMVRGQENQQVFNQAVAQQDIPPQLLQRMQAMQPGAPIGFGGDGGTSSASPQMDETGPRAGGIAPEQTPQQLLQTAARSGVLTLQDAFRLQSLGEEGAVSTAFDEDPVTGTRFATRGRSISPSGINPAKLKTEIESLQDAEGNNYNIIRDPKSGKPMIVKPPNTAARKKLEAETIAKLNEQLSKVDEEISAWHTNQDRFDTDPKAKGRRRTQAELDSFLRRRKQIETELFSDEQPNAAPAGGDKVLVTKDGKQFRLPRTQLQEAIAAGYLEVKPAE